MKDGTFTADRLLELYECVAEAEDAIPRLRCFVLDLAVRGKLVEQDPSDEPAVELLKRIAKEKARLVKAGEIRKPKPFDTIDEPPFAVPGNWAWSRMREVTTDRGQMIPNARFTYIDVSAINKEAGVIEAPTVLEPAEAPSRARKTVRKGDVIYSCVRPYLLNVAVVEGDIEPAPIASTAFAIINGLGLILPRYIWIVLRSPFMVAAVEETQRGQAYPAINDADFAVLPFPLPPLAEQQRIVAKVDELMALCDRLQAARAGREAVRDRLTAASLARLTAPETDAETFPAHARFALQNLPALTAHAAQIETLRQTILNLAVRGKLVKQDPSDERAPELLKRVAKEIAAKRKHMGLRPQDALRKVDTSDIPFELPLGWTWARFPEVGVFARGKSRHRPRNDPTLYVHGTIPFVQTGDVARSFGLITTNSSAYNETGLQQSLLWPAGTMCITIAANIADSGILTFDACFPDSVVGLLVASCFENGRFFEYFVRTAKANLAEFAPATAQKNINLGILEMVLIPLPPLAEQRRIVAKVDALMALCDQLEASLVTASTTRSRLLEAILHEALAQKTEEDAAA